MIFKIFIFRAEINFLTAEKHSKKETRKFLYAANFLLEYYMHNVESYILLHLNSFFLWNHWKHFQCHCVNNQPKNHILYQDFHSSSDYIIHL